MILLNISIRDTKHRLEPYFVLVLRLCSSQDSNKFSLLDSHFLKTPILELQW